MNSNPRQSYETLTKADKRPNTASGTAPKETFIEVIERRKTPDMAAYLAIGANIADQTDSWRSLYRVRYDKTGVKWEFLACAHVRLVCFEEAENGERIGVFAGRGGVAIRSGSVSRKRTSRTHERLTAPLVSPVDLALSFSRQGTGDTASFRPAKRGAAAELNLKNT